MFLKAGGTAQSRTWTCWGWCWQLQADGGSMRPFFPAFAFIASDLVFVGNTPFTSIYTVRISQISGPGRIWLSSMKSRPKPHRSWARFLHPGSSQHIPEGHVILVTFRDSDHGQTWPGLWSSRVDHDQCLPPGGKRGTIEADRSAMLGACECCDMLWCHITFFWFCFEFW